jgi:hypothetical protein
MFVGDGFVKILPTVGMPTRMKSVCRIFCQLLQVPDPASLTITAHPAVSDVASRSENDEIKASEAFAMMQAAKLPLFPGRVDVAR